MGAMLEVSLRPVGDVGGWRRCIRGCVAQLEATALYDGKAWVLRVARVGLGARATEERGASGRRNAPGVQAGQTEAVEGYSFRHAGLV